MHLMSGRAKHVAVYPNPLCDSISKGIRAQLDADELIARMPRKLIASISLARPFDVNSIHNEEADASCLDDVVQWSR